MLPQFTKNTDNIGQGVFLLFALVLPFIRLDGLSQPTEIPQWAIIDLVAGALCLFWVLSRDNQRVHWSELHSLLGLWLAGLIVLGLLRLDTAGITEGLLRQIALTLVFFASSQFLATDQGRKKLIQIILLTGSLIGLIGLIQYLFKTDLELPSTTVHPSVFVNKNYAVAFMALVVPVAFARLLAAETRQQRYLVGTAYFISLAYLLATFSRGGLVALASSLIFTLAVFQINPVVRRAFLQYRSTQYLVILISCLSIITIIYGPKGISALTEADSHLETSTNLVEKYGRPVSARLSLYENTLDAISTSPLTGMGPGGFFVGIHAQYNHPRTMTFTSETGGITHAHQEYLHRLAEYGIPLGVLFIVILVYIWTRTFTTIKKSGQTNQADSTRQLFPLFLGLTAMLSHGLVDVPLFYPVTGFYFWMIAGAITPLIAYRQQVFSLGKINIIVVTVLLISLLIVNSAFHSNAISGNLTATQAMKAIIKKDCANATRLANQAFERAPEDLVVWNRLMRAHGLCSPDPLLRLTSSYLVLEKDPNHPHALLQRANANFERGNLDLALDDYSRIAYLLPHRPTGYLGMANTLNQQGKLKASAQDYETANRLMTKLGKTWLNNPETIRLYRFSSIIARMTQEAGQ